MSEYELLIAIAEDQSEENQKKIIKQVTDMVEKARGEVTQTDSWGKKALAYSIGKNKNGFYWLLTIKGESRIPKIISDSLRIEDSVIRFLLTQKIAVKKVSRKKAPVKAKKLEENIIIR